MACLFAAWAALSRKGTVMLFYSWSWELNMRVWTLLEQKSIVPIWSIYIDRYIIMAVCWAVQVALCMYGKYLLNK